MGALLRIEARSPQETSLGQSNRRDAPIEPPIGYGPTYRSIFPESQFGTVTPRSFGRPVAGNPKPDRCRPLARVEIADACTEAGMTIPCRGVQPACTGRLSSRPSGRNPSARRGCAGWSTICSTRWFRQLRRSVPADPPSRTIPVGFPRSASVVLVV